MAEEQLIAAGWTRRNMGQSVVYTRDGEWIEVGNAIATLHSYTGRMRRTSGANSAEAFARLSRMDWGHGKTVAQYCGVPA